MNANRQVLDMIRLGDILGGVQRLHAGNSPDESLLLELNRALYSPRNPHAEALIQQETERHETLIHDATGAERSLIMFNLGCFALRQDEILNANFYFQETARADPGRLPARHNLAYTLEMMAESELAREEYQQVLQQDPEFLLSRVNLALMDLADGRMESCLESLRGLCLDHPENPGLLYFLCRALLTRRESADVREALDVLNALPNWQHHRELAECHAFAQFHAGELPRARAEFQTLLEGAADNLFAVTGLLKVTAAQGDRAALRQWVEHYDRLNSTAAARALMATFNSSE